VIAVVIALPQLLVRVEAEVREHRHTRT
jgi:hypothetical protein